MPSIITQDQRDGANLIIPIHRVGFLYRGIFLILEWFPRFVPFYGIREWGDPSGTNLYGPYYDKS